MSKPPVDRPQFSVARGEQWKKSDRELAHMIDTLLKTILNLEKWEFYSPKLGNTITYAEFHRLCRRPTPDANTIEMMSRQIMELPYVLKVMRERLRSLLEKYRVNSEEYSSYLEQGAQWSDWAEKELEEKDALIRQQAHDIELLKVRLEFANERLSNRGSHTVPVLPVPVERPHKPRVKVEAPKSEESEPWEESA